MPGSNTPIGQMHESVRKHLESAIPAIADLNQTITTSGPTTEEVQAISDKVDALLAALRTLGLLSS